VTLRIGLTVDCGKKEVGSLSRREGRGPWEARQTRFEKGRSKDPRVLVKGRAQPVVSKRKTFQLYFRAGESETDLKGLGVL